MKRRLIVWLVAVVALTLVAGLAWADGEDNLTVKMDLGRNRFTEPATIAVGIQVINQGEDDMPGPVTLYDPSGKQIEEFGAPVLTVGASQSWTGQWRVTQSQLEAGRITFSIKYSIVGDDGELQPKTKRFSKTITYEPATAAVEVNRTITPTTAGKGQEVTVTYDVINTGNVDITNVKIQEHKNVSATAGTIEKVAAGEKGSYPFTVKMGTRDLTSSATITYTAGSTKQTLQKEAATIRYGEMKLSASLSADKKGGLVGDTVKLTLTLKNTGKVDYAGVTVTDPVLGEVFSGQTVPAGETVKLEKELPIAASQDYQFTVTGQGADGMDVETATGKVSVTAVEPSEVVNLTVQTSVAQETIHEIPGTAEFTVAVTNTSTAAVKDVAVVANGMTVYTFPTIEPGETREFTRSFAVSMAGTYQFSARVKNQLNETQTFAGNTVYIRYSAPTPVPTEVPIVTPPAPHTQPIPEKDDLPEDYTKTAETLNQVGWGLLIPVGVGALLILIGLIGRLIRGVRSMGAVDHLERSGLRDYEAPSHGKDKGMDLPDEPAGEDKAEDAAEAEAGKDEEPARRHRRAEGGETPKP